MRIKLILLLVVFIISSSACVDNSNTDLSRITLDNIKIGDNINLINTANYNLTNRFPDDNNTVNYEEWIIKTNDKNIITKIHCNFNDISVSVNSDSSCENINEIIQALGDNYKSKWYDKEQHLKQITYTDSKNLIQAAFIYDNNNEQLVWIIIESIN